jgi:UDP-N-acetylglucosamine 2-epimerase (non-hydrolysing)
MGEQPVDASTPMTATTPTVHVVLGTLAEYLKTAPVLARMTEQDLPHRLVDVGQHGATNPVIRDRLGIPDPDVDLGDGSDKETIGQVVTWATRQAARLASGRHLRQHVFAGRGGVAIVHGDTPSTLLATLMARRAGLTVAHIEAGLRSGRVTDPFPEEAIRLVVMRLSHLLFAPDQVAVDNLVRMKVRGRVIPLPANTVIEALAQDLGQVDVGDDPTDPSGRVPDRSRSVGQGPVVVTLHRVENLKRQSRLDLFHEVLVRIAAEREVVFAMHKPTIAVMRANGMEESLRRAGVRLQGLASHEEFVGMVASAPYVITDGGSIQEECALLGVPTLLWRRVSERPDGIGHNVVVCAYDRRVIDGFLADPQAHAVPPTNLDARPSQVIVDHIRPLLTPRTVT